MTEEVREALMRLAMCAREECGICKHKDECGYDMQYELATRNMNIVLNALKSRPKGKWIMNKEKQTVEPIYNCSECGHEAWGEYEKTNFCGNCGAEMRGEE